MKRTGIKNREKAKNKGLTSLTKPTLFFILLVVAGVIGMMIVVFYVDKVTKLELKEKTYQYFAADVSEYEPGATISDEEMSSIININNKEYNIDPTPIYSYSAQRIYLPKTYSWYNGEDNSYWRVPEFSEITFNGSIFSCVTNNKPYSMSSGFLFDNDSNYIFLDSGKITLDNKTSYKISPMSFYSQNYGMIRIYDYETRTPYIIEEKVKGATFNTNDGGYEISLSRGTFSHSGVTTLLPASPTLLDSIEDRGN